MNKINKHEEKLNKILEELNVGPVTREYRFDKPLEGKPRRWRFDFALVDFKIALEVEGGTWSRGRHVNPLGFAADCEKYNAATKQGWKVFRLVPSLIASEYIESLLM